MRRYTTPVKPLCGYDRPYGTDGPTAAPTSGAIRRATSVGMIVSVSSGPWGPCCSVDPTGTMTVWCWRRKASSSGLVISPRKTVGGFTRAPPRSADGVDELADALDPAGDDVASLQVSVGTG